MLDTKISRRKLLAAAGLTGAFLPSLLSRKARAQSAPPIKRIVIFVTSHGTVRENWWMRRDNPAYGDWEYPFDNADPNSFSQILRPLHPHRNRLLVLEGLAQASTLGDRAVNNHDAGHYHLLTGARMQNGSNTGGASVDQIIARAVARPDRIRSLELAWRDNMFDGGFVNQGAGQRLPVLADPGQAFDRLFPGGTGAPALSERDRINNARRSVLDFVHTEFTQVAPKLGSDDRRKLEMHRDMIRDLESRIQGLTGVTCSAPARPGSSQSITTTLNAMADLTAAAFACDLTRVVTIQSEEMPTSAFGGPPGDVHQDIAHQTDTNPTAAMWMSRYNQLHAEHFAHLLDRLAMYQDGDRNLLDNTVAVWLTELATGPHDLDKIPVVMAGSCAGAFRVGRYVSYSQSFPNPHEHALDGWGPPASRPIGPGHSRLLVSLMQAMGLPNNEIGLTSVVTRDRTNTTIPLTGPLPRLTA
jgi:hypothetical protein